MRFEDLKVDKNIRLAVGDLETLARHIEENGLIDPIVIRPDGTILRGHRRRAAIQLLRDKATKVGEHPPFDEIPVTIRETETEVDRIKLQLLDTDGSLRKNLTLWEVAKALHALKAEGLVMREIAVIGGHSPTHANALIRAVESASPELVAILDRGANPQTTFLYALSRIPHSEQVEAFQTWATKHQGRGRKKGVPDKKEYREGVRTSPKQLRFLLRDYEELGGPKEESAIELLRWLLGEETERPIPRVTDARAGRETYMTKSRRLAKPATWPEPSKEPSRPRKTSHPKDFESCS